MNIVVNEEVLFWAFRYALGRTSYCVADVQGALVYSWNSLSPSMQCLVKREIELAIDNDKAGMSCDKELWNQVLELELG